MPDEQQNLPATQLTPQKKRGRGRTRWVPPDLVKVEEAAIGCSNLRHLAAGMGISLTTLMERQKDFPEFLDAIKRGRARGYSMLENRAFTIATTGDPTKGATVTMLIFLLKTLVGYREDQPQPDVDTQAQEIRREFGGMDAEAMDYQLAIVRHMTRAERLQYLELLQRSRARLEAGQLPEAQAVVLQNANTEEAEIVPAPAEEVLDGRIVPATPEEIEELKNA